VIARRGDEWDGRRSICHGNGFRLLNEERVRYNEGEETIMCAVNLPDGKKVIYGEFKEVDVIAFE
jgi:hypothetical protein